MLDKWPQFPRLTARLESNATNDYKRDIGFGRAAVTGRNAAQSSGSNVLQHGHDGAHGDYSLFSNDPAAAHAFQTAG